MASFGDKAQMSTQVKGISRPMTVLVVSPDDQGREDLAGLLRSTAGSELQVDVASGVADSLRLFHKNHPDLMLISTAQLSGIGAEIASYVRSSEGNRHTGLIFVDGPADDDAAQSVACLEMGADDFVRRGTTAAELMARIRQSQITPAVLDRRTDRPGKYAAVQSQICRSAARLPQG